MKRGKRRAITLWACYRRRKMIDYVAKEKAYKNRLVDFLVSDGVDLLQICEDSVKVNICHQKFDNIIATVKSIPNPSYLTAYIRRYILIIFAIIVSNFKQSID